VKQDKTDEQNSVTAVHNSWGTRSSNRYVNVWHSSGQQRPSYTKWSLASNFCARKLL